MSLQSLKLPQQVHQALIKNICKEDIILHISNDSTGTETREKPNYQTKGNQGNKK